MITIHQRYRRTDRRGRHAIARPRFALYSALRGKKSAKHALNVVAARPLMLSHCLATSPTDTYNDVTSRQQHPATSLLQSPTSLRGVAVVGDGQYSVMSPVNSSPESTARPWPTSPTDHRGTGQLLPTDHRPAGGQFQPDSWVRGSAESLVGRVRNTRLRLLLS